MEEIIDMHAHLGDILFPDGGSLIMKKGVKKKLVFDILSFSESFNHRFADTTSTAYWGSWAHRMEVKTSMLRNSTGTAENFIKSMDEAGIRYSVSLPVPPSVSFADIRMASCNNSRIIPFTGIDFSRDYDIQAALHDDVANGAKGMKLHPVLQREKLTSRKTFEAVEAFAPFNDPILVHTGRCYYYHALEDKRAREIPEYGACEDFIALVKAFPRVRFIAGHAGIMEWPLLKEYAGTLKNFLVDITFRGPQKVRELIETMGPDRVVFASDWPWGNREPAVRILKQACHGDRPIENRVLFENAAELLRL